MQSHVALQMRWDDWCAALIKHSCTVLQGDVGRVYFAFAAALQMPLSRTRIAFTLTHLFRSCTPELPTTTSRTSSPSRSRFLTQHSSSTTSHYNSIELHTSCPQLPVHVNSTPDVIAGSSPLTPLKEAQECPARSTCSPSA